MHELRNQHGVNNYGVLFSIKAKKQNNNIEQRTLSSFITIPLQELCLHPTSNSMSIDTSCKNNTPVVYVFVLRRLARKRTKIYNACGTIVRLIKPFVLRQLIKSRFAAVVVFIRSLLLWSIKCHDVEKFLANKAVRLVVFHNGKVCTIRPWKLPESHTGILIWSNGKRPF